MPTDVLNALARLVELEHDHLLAAWRAQVRQLPTARELDTPTLNDHIPDLLVELASALRSGTDESIADAVLSGSPPQHGMQRVRDTFDIEEVVAEYNILRECVHDLAERHGLNMQGAPFHVLNRVLDGAIGSAVQAFATTKALEVQRRREEYLAFVAHDLRTPLNAIALSGRVLEVLLASSAAAPAEALRMFNALKRNVSQLERLVGKILEENSSLEPEMGVELQRREFDLWSLVEGLTHDLHPVAGTGTTTLRNEVPEELVVFADASLLRRIFQNLIGNAIAHTPHGEVVIGACGSDGGGTECWVRDNGEGIAEARRAAVFDKGETKGDTPGGMGLGLAIVKTFVEAHEGHVTVESEVGRGTTFRFTLPARQC
ncbi:MAG: HAMP domain-containing histidine kinase [Gammaproteobacteria bacterium]|nr:HAMP domain-containing histidine kinase [Gammaproteobacteria bacterium]